MSHRFLALKGVLMAVSAAASLHAEEVSTKHRTPDGQPSLEGIWSNATITPLERPLELAGKQFFTEQEAAEYERRFLKETNKDRRDGDPAADVGRAYNDSWWDVGTKVVPTRRTSFVVDPPDGRIPPLTTMAQKRAADRSETLRRPPSGPEDRGLSERCILWPTAGPPMLPSAYNNNYQILQTPGYVVILIEMIHDVRIIPLDGRPHLPDNIREWMGDSRGRWEGNTLVVDTTNFTDKTSFRGSDRNLHLIERFTRTAPGAIIYQFTVDDPTAFTKSWTGEVPLTNAQGPIYEYACHEGNYSMANILSGARAEEKAADQSREEGVK